MRIYICKTHDSHYLGGMSVIVAEDKHNARILLDEKLIADGLEAYETHPYELEEIVLDVDRVVHFDNGDY